MKKTISTFAVFVMVAALCVGCKKPETSPPEPATQPKKETPAAKNWQPETSKQPTTRGDSDGEDHTGHDHGPGEHQH